MGKLLLLLLLGVTACCLFVFVAADTRGDQSSPKAHGVLQLKKGNFKNALKNHSQLLVYFYDPMYAEGHRVLNAFEGAAAELEGSKVRSAVLDVTQEKDLAEELNATNHLTIRLYLSGDKNTFSVCPVPANSASILTWLKRREGSAADLVTDFSQSEASQELTVVGFFKDLEHEYVNMFYAAAIELPDVRFDVTQDNQVISKYGLTHDVVLILKQSKLIKAFKVIPGTSKEDLIVFITVYRMDPVTEYNGQTASQILSSPVPNHALLFVNKGSEDFKDIFSAFNTAADAFRLQILFVSVDVSEPRNGRLMEYFRVRGFEAPLIRIVNMTDHVTYNLLSEDFSLDTITKFCQSYLEGKAKPKLQSEPIPEGWEEEPVKELVGMTLEKVAFHPNKTVFVLFYLPYSQASRALFPLWEELAEAFKDRDNVVIARFDTSANDINMSMHGASPSLCLFPALYAERAVVYTGEKNLKDLIKFVGEEMETAKKYRVQEDADRRKYEEALRAEVAKKDKAKQIKIEL